MQQTTPIPLKASGITLARRTAVLCRKLALIPPLISSLTLVTLCRKLQNFVLVCVLNRLFFILNPIRAHVLMLINVINWFNKQQGHVYHTL